MLLALLSTGALLVGLLAPPVARRLGMASASRRHRADALRVQSHELTNRLYTIAGLLQLGRPDDALAFIAELTGSDAPRGAEGRRWDVADPRVAALLMAKAALAAEHGVTLEVASEEGVEHSVTDPTAVITVLGNLIDNALDAVRSGEDDQRWIEVSIGATGDCTLTVAVTDSGPGIPAEQRDRVFDLGFTTKSDAPGSRGIGLALVRRTVERHGGSITLATPGAGGGARFDVRLPDAVRMSPTASIVAR
jgi:two-component system CitB family sensor kinase